MPLETFADTINQLLLRIRAGCPVIYLISYEERRVLDNIARLLRVLRRESPRKLLWTYYDSFGLQKYPLLEPYGTGPLNPNEPIEWLDVPGLTQEPDPARPTDAVAALGKVCDARPTQHAELGDSVTVFFDLHPF